MMLSKRKFILYLTFSMLMLNACSNKAKYLKPTGKSAFVPDNHVGFSTYVNESKKNIEEILNSVRKNDKGQAYLGKYTNFDAAIMRSPFQVTLEDKNQCNSADVGNNKGFLLIHGLNDSPYLMKSMSDLLHTKYPCSLIRTVLLPGHGTVVGDSLNMKKEDWKKIVKYGVDSFKKENRITDLYLVGFSTGTSLSIDYMKHNPSISNEDRNDKIKGLVFLSTAIKAKSKFAFLSPLLSYVKDWLSIFKERDAARYESFSFNSGVQFLNLTKDMLDKEYALKVPTLMAVSADDITIDARAAREFYCYSSDIKRRALVWYQSIDKDINSEISLENSPELMCDNIIEVTPNSPDYKKYKTVNISHIAIPVSPTDEHYGFEKGRYRNCKSYESAGRTEQFDKCQSNKFSYVFGENEKLLKKSGKLDGNNFRRGTFNPDFENLKYRILCFVDDACPINNILKY